MKILLIMPKFFNYPETIQMGLRNLGHDVKWVDDRPSNDPFTKALVRVNKEVLSRISKASGMTRKKRNTILSSSCRDNPYLSARSTS